MPSLAPADQTQSSGALSLLIFALPLLLIALMIFSQRRRAKQFEQAQASLEVGQEVSTTSGLRGRLAGLDGDLARIEAAPGVVLTFDRRAVLPATAMPAAGGASPAGERDPERDGDPA